MNSATLEETVKFGVGFSNAQIKHKLNPANGGSLGFKDLSMGNRVSLMFPLSFNALTPITGTQRRINRVVKLRQPSPLTSPPASGKFHTLAGVEGTFSFLRPIIPVLKLGYKR